MTMKDEELFLRGKLNDTTSGKTQNSVIVAEKQLSKREGKHFGAFECKCILLCSHTFELIRLKYID